MDEGGVADWKEPAMAAITISDISRESMVAPTEMVEA